MDKSLELELLYFQITDLWKSFCEHHNQLLSHTFDEYALLLDGKLEDLESKLTEKNEVITEITKLEKVRKILIDRSNELTGSNIESVSELLSFMGSLDVEKKEQHLFRFNALLIDIIEKIQKQNKKNQIFINKAIHNLQEIRLEASGEKNYKTYNSNANTSRSVNGAR